MDEFQDFDNFNPEPQEKSSSLNKGLILFTLLTLPFYLRLIFYNVVYDLPLGWMVFAGISLLGVIAFSKNTESGWQLIFYGYKGIYSKYLVLFLIPILVTAFVEDLKLSQSAVLHNRNYVQTLDKTMSPNEAESVEILYETLNVVNKIGGYMVYVVQLPVLGFFKKIEVVNIYQGCLIKKLEGGFSEKHKDVAYEGYFKSYWQQYDNHNFSGIGQIIQQSYMFRLGQTLKHMLLKVFLFYPFDPCLRR